MQNQDDADLDLEVVYLARKEIATRTLKMASTNLPLLIVLYFYNFNIHRYLIPFRAMCIFAGVILFGRMIYAKKILNFNPEKLLRHWNSYLLLAYSQVTILGMIYSVAAWELGLSDPHSTTWGILLGGAAYLAILTTLFDKSLFIYTQVCLLVPIIVACYSEYRITGLTSIILMSLFLIFQTIFAVFKQVTILRKQIFERIRNNLQLERANQKLVAQSETIAQTARTSALGEMAAGISHEINNPLMIISGNNELIEKAVQKEPIDKNLLQRRVQKSKVAIDRISYIIKGLLTYSRQNHEVPKEDTPLETIINETFIFCFEMLKSHDIQFQIDSVPKILLSCRPLQISEVLFNLIKNADDQLQGLPNKEDRWVKILFQEDYREILIKVINGGPIIPKEYHDKLFQPFFTTKPVGSRVGLGLPISKGIIEDNGGELIFERNAGFTTFIIKLPKSINV